MNSHKYIQMDPTGRVQALRFARRGVVAVLASAAVLAGCSSGQHPKFDTDERIYSVHESFGRLQTRHNQLNSAGNRISAYPMAKAQCWMDVAFHEYTRNDRSRFWSGAMGEADRLLSALEAKQTPPDDTPMVNGAARLRDDLWTRASRLKQDPGFRCAADRVACMEVHLVHAGNEHNQGGWRYSNPYIRIAEDMMDLAERDAASCEQPKPAPTPGPTVVPVPAPAPDRPLQVVEPRIIIHKLSADILFEFDRYDYNSIRPEGRLQLNRIAGQLKDDYANIRSIRIGGHTDRIGTDAYNQRLSEQRANTVREFLVRRGTEPAKITAAGFGKTRPVTVASECSDNQPRARLISCLAPDRRIEIEIDGERR